MNLPFLDLTSKEELSFSLPFIYLKVKLKLEMTHLRFIDLCGKSKA